MTFFAVFRGAFYCSVERFKTQFFLSKLLQWGFFYHPSLIALKTLVSCQFSGLNCYLRQIESSQVYLLGLSNRNAELVPLVMHVWLPLDGRNS